MLKDTLKDTVTFLTLVAFASALYYISGIYPNEYVSRGYLAFLAIAIVYLAFRIGEKLVAWHFEDPRTEYMFRRIVTIVFYSSVLFIMLGVFIEQTRALLVSYGLIAAGIAVAVQDFFRNFAGGMIIFITGIYRIGDRIEINGRYGDVIDIGILYTTLMETREWVGGDQHTGRLSVLPNSFVLNNAVNNYTKDLRFVFDEIMLPITYDSDLKKAKALILDIVRKETSDITVEAAADVEKSGQKYYLQEEVVEPAIYITVNDDWVAYNIRYVTRVRERRVRRSRLWALIFDEVMKSGDIKIASENIDINIIGLPDVRLDKAGKDYPKG